MRVVIVGHGRSILKAEDIDSYDFVIRLKQAEIGGSFGEKTSAIVATNNKFSRDGIPFWHYCPQKSSSGLTIDKERWDAWYTKFNPAKPPSTGMAAIFAVKDVLPVNELTLYGFDSHLIPGTMQKHYKLFRRIYAHDNETERRATSKLFDRVIYGPS